MSFAATPLTILADLTPTRTTVHVQGEIDLATAPQLRRALEHHLSHGPSQLHIDLSGVPFMDSSGLHVLLVVVRTARLTGSFVALSDASPQVERLLDLAGVTLPRVRPLASIRTPTRRRPFVLGAGRTVGGTFGEKVQPHVDR